MVLVKTALAQQVLKDRSLPLAPRQRGALILFDGKRTDTEVLAATAATGVTAADLSLLREQGLLAPAGTSQGFDATAPAPLAREPRAAAGGDRYLQAWRLATRLTSGMGLKGFRLNLAVEAASNLHDLQALAPRIREAVGPEKFAPLEAALQGR